MFLFHAIQHAALQTQPMLLTGHFPSLMLAGAPAPAPTPTPATAPSEFSNLSTFLTAVESLLQWLGGILCAIGIMVAALLRITAFGNERKIAISNLAISAAIVGLIILLLATAFQKFITRNLPASSVNSPSVALYHPVQSRYSVAVDGSHVTITLLTQRL
ncbi:hypothetical protein ccbrp13_31010 [Ktedonobacteria bacterium brp13]|nr:hypothetical protein ccbrp13_31010 [Ktedonobacteria bacterium brp13]